MQKTISTLRGLLSMRLPSWKSLHNGSNKIFDDEPQETGWVKEKASYEDNGYLSQNDGKIALKQKEATWIRWVLLLREKIVGGFEVHLWRLAEKSWYCRQRCCLNHKKAAERQLGAK